MQRIPLAGLCVIYFCCTVWGNGQTDSDSFVKAAHEYESYVCGKRLVIESGTDHTTLEVNEDQDVMRLVLEKRDLKANVLTHRFAHYVSIPLAQHVMSSSSQDPRARETNNVMHSVEFLSTAKTIPQVISELGVFSFVIQDQLLSEFIKQSQCTSLPSTEGRRGIRCEAADGKTAEVWVDDNGRLSEFTDQIKPGDQLADGQVCRPGEWSKLTRKLQWNARSGQLDQVHASVKASGGVSGSRDYLIKEVAEIERPLDSYIHLEDFALVDGVVVSCQAQPGKPFQFLHGKVVAIVDAASLASAQSARWWGSPKGNLVYYFGLVFVISFTMSILYWQRNKR